MIGSSKGLSSGLEDLARRLLFLSPAMAPPQKNMMHFGIFGFMLLVFSPLGMNDMNLDKLGYISISNFEAGEFKDVWKKPAAGGWRYLIITFIPPLWKAIQESHWLGDMSLHPQKNNWQASARNSHASTYMHIAAHFTHINLTKHIDIHVIDGM